MALSIAQPSGGVTSALDAGAVTTGAVNQLICDSGPLAAGNGEPWSYKISAVTFQGGTVDTNQANMLVNIGGTNTGGIISGGLTIGKLLSVAALSFQFFRVSVTSGQHVYIVIGNTTPGVASVYNASFTVTRLQLKYGDP